MIKVDISRVIPPRLGTYLLGIIPGVFFEASIAIGNPHFAVSVLSRVRDIYPFGPYALLVLFLTAGLFIGQGFFLAAWIVERVIAAAFGLWRYGIRNTFGSQWAYRSFAKLQGIPPKQNLFIRWLGRVISWARGSEFSSEARPVLKCLYVAVRRRLKVRYGIAFDGQSDEGEWRAWYTVLGKPLKGFNEAALYARTCLGCGLAGFTALYTFPQLREQYFAALCLIFTFVGCFASVDLVRWRFNPVLRSLARLRSVSLELSEASTLAEKPDGDAEIDADEGD
ncbi:MAG: hypothetical protein WCC05_10485 [Candidatus Sulfotelmatobacter sp.]